jgi:hypothetical protein
VRSFLANPMAHLAVFAAVVTACFVMYVLAGASVSPSFDSLATVGWWLMLILWTDADARRLRRLPCFDFGFLVGVFFPVSVAWYCMWSRGWRGLFLIVVLLALWFAPYVTASVVWLVKYGRAV